MLHRAPGFHKSFVLAGGLAGLAARLEESDLHVRAHAVEVLLRISADDDLRWYDTPSNDDAAAMHAELLDLQDELIAGLVANSRDSYPGGEKTSLDLLAQWLGWARSLHAEDAQVLRPSRALLRALSDWVPRAESRGDPDEAALAKRLFDDVSRSPPHDGAGWVGGVSLQRADGDDDVVEAGVSGFDLDAAPAPPPPPPRASPKSVPTPPKPKPPPVKLAPRAAGNAAFASGDFEAALAHYDAALAASATAQATSTLHCNRATCLFKLSARDARNRAAAASWLDKSEAACAAAITADGTNAKARYRLAQTLAALGDDSGPDSRSLKRRLLTSARTIYAAPAASPRAASTKMSPRARRYVRRGESARS